MILRYLPTKQLTKAKIILLLFSICTISLLCQTNSDNEEQIGYIPRGSNMQMWKDFNFVKFMEPDHLNCDALAKGDKEALQDYLDNDLVRISLEPPLSLKCEDIFRRIQHISHDDNPNDVSIAIARNVYARYFTQETFLAMHYSSQNQYCFAIQTNATDLFKDSMWNLRNCLANVHIVEEQFQFDSGGHSQDLAHFRCIQLLLKEPGWKYILLLQNDDLIFKTKSEISQILKVMDGAQLLGSQDPWNAPWRFPHKQFPNAKKANIFKNSASPTHNQLHGKITFVHSLNEVFLSREFVQALDQQLNMENVIGLFNLSQYGIDEFLFPTLAFNGHLGLPGQARKVCYHPDYYGPVRYHHWANLEECRSDKVRHNICLLTVEYLGDLLKRNEIIANKVWPQDDFGVALCMVGFLKERSKANLPMKGLEEYEKLPQVQEMRARKRGDFDPLKFKCPAGYIDPMDSDKKKELDD